MEQGFIKIDYSLCSKLEFRPCSFTICTVSSLIFLFKAVRLKDTVLVFCQGCTLQAHPCPGLCSQETEGFWTESLSISLEMALRTGTQLFLMVTLSSNTHVMSIFDIVNIFSRFFSSSDANLPSLCQPNNFSNNQIPDHVLLLSFSSLRYALICQQCLSHNGMALKEEFEYVGKTQRNTSTLSVSIKHCFHLPPSIWQCSISYGS